MFHQQLHESFACILLLIRFSSTPWWSGSSHQNKLYSLFQMIIDKFSSHLTNFPARSLLFMKHHSLCCPIASIFDQIWLLFVFLSPKSHEYNRLKIQQYPIIRQNQLIRNITPSTNYSDLLCWEHSPLK